MVVLACGVTYISYFGSLQNSEAMEVRLSKGKFFNLQLSFAVKAWPHGVVSRCSAGLQGLRLSPCFQFLKNIFFL